MEFISAQSILFSLAFFIGHYLLKTFSIILIFWTDICGIALMYIDISDVTLYERFRLLFHNCFIKCYRTKHFPRYFKYAMNLT